MSSPGPAPSDSRLAAALEMLSRWRNGLLLVALVGALVVGFQFPGLRPQMALGVAVAVPVLVVLLAFIRAGDAGVAVAGAWLVVGGGAAAVGEWAMAQAFFPPEPHATTTLSTAEPRAHMDGPVDRFRLAVHAELPGRLRDGAEASYELLLSRSDETVEVSGTLYRRVTRDSSRRGPPSSNIDVHQTERHELSMGGDLPIEVHLVSSEDLPPRGLDVSLHETFSLDEMLMGLVGVILLAAAVLEGWSARRFGWTPLTASASIAIGLGVYIAMRLDPDQPLTTVLAGLLVSIVAAGGVGLALGLLAVLVLRPRAS